MLIQAADQFNILSVLVVNLCSEVFTERMGGYILIPRTEPVANLFQMLLHCPDTDRKYQIIALNALRVRIFKEEVVDLFLNLETANLSGLMLNNIKSVTGWRLDKRGTPEGECIANAKPYIRLNNEDRSNPGIRLYAVSNALI